MQIEREKFFALTATLAGFWPTAACVIRPGGGSATPGETAVGERAPPERGIGGPPDTGSDGAGAASTG